jgi:hypothetical protein
MFLSSLAPERWALIISSMCVTDGHFEPPASAYVFSWWCLHTQLVLSAFFFYGGMGGGGGVKGDHRLKNMRFSKGHFNFSNHRGKQLFKVTFSFFN